MTVTVQFLHYTDKAKTADEAFDILRNEMRTTITGFKLVNNLPDEFRVDGAWRFEYALTFWQWVNGRNMELTKRPFVSMSHIMQQNCFKALLSEIDNNIDLLNEWADAFFGGNTALCLNYGKFYFFMGVA